MKLFLLTLLMSFSTFAFDPTVKFEYLVNNDLAQTDILFVIDNSGSMDSHQKLIAELSDEFLKQFEDVKFKITAVSTDKADSLTNAIVSNSSIDPVKELAKLMTSFGINGDATELVFKRAHDFILSDAGKNFMRRNTPLEVIIVTDEEEQSSETVQEMMNLSSFKKMTVSGLLPLSPQGSCLNSVARNNSKIEELISQSGGLALDLCKNAMALSSDYENLAKEIIKRATHKTMPISKFVFRDSVDTNSIRVYYGSQIIQRGFIGTGWTYDEATNTLYLGENIILGNQPQGTKLTIQYDIL